jgi:hypothetical protein
MFKKKNIIRIFRLIVICSILLPSVSSSAAGNLRLSGKSDKYINPNETGEFRAEVQITTIDNKLKGTNSRIEIPVCIDSVLVSSMSNSSKMAFLTTSNIEGITPITIGQHIISTYEDGKCSSNSATIDIQPNTWYVYEVPISDEKAISQNRSSAISSRISNQIVPTKPLLDDTLKTVRTGGSSFDLLFLMLPVLCYLEIKKLLLR